MTARISRETDAAQREGNARKMPDGEATVGALVALIQPGALIQKLAWGRKRSLIRISNQPPLQIPKDAFVQPIHRNCDAAVGPCFCCAFLEQM